MDVLEFNVEQTAWVEEFLDKAATGEFSPDDTLVGQLLERWAVYHGFVRTTKREFVIYPPGGTGI